MEPWKQYQTTSAPWEQYQPKGFFANVKNDLQGRGAELADAVNAFSTGQQGLTQTAIQALGKSGAGAINDILGQGILTITPDYVKQKVSDIASPILESQPVQSMVQGYGEFAQSNPNAARTLESLGNIASMLPITKGGKIASQAATTVAKPVAQAAGEVAMKAITPNIAPEIAPLAQRASQFGIPLSLDQVAPSRVRNTLQKVSQELPFSGVENFQQTQLKNWNKALAKETLGVDAERLNPSAIKTYLKKADEDFNSILDNKTLNITDTQPLDNIIYNASFEAAPDTIKIVEKNVNQLKNLISKGEISGNQLASVRSNLVKRSGRVQGELKNYLGDIVDYIDNNIDLVATPEESAKLAQARFQYRNYKTIQPLLEKSPSGNINPTSLMNRVASSRYINAATKEVGQDPLVDLARIGKEFLPAKGGSDTFQKMAGFDATKNILTGAAAVTDLGSTAGALAGNRLYQQGYNQSQNLLNRGLQKALNPVLAKPTNMLGF